MSLSEAGSVLLVQYTSGVSNASFIAETWRRPGEVETMYWSLYHSLDGVEVGIFTLYLKGFDVVEFLFLGNSYQCIPTGF